MKTHVTKKGDIESKWYIVDATDVRLGQLASKIAPILIGKGKVNYVANLNVGDHVIVINAPKISVSGNKMEDKMYYRHSGFTGNLRQENLATLIARRPEDVIKKAVKGMLPKNKLGVQMLKNLHVRAGEDHDHEAQKPEILDLNK